MRYLELLAPARDMNIGIAAIDCGADAVYIGGPAFGARQAAGNSIGDLKTLCGYAHRFGARVFVTLNTILFDSELEEAARLLGEISRIGADAVIVQDLALLKLNTFGIPMHASTQCSIRTPQKAAELESFGFSRVTLERQLSLPQVREIAGAVRCETECFVHGALCMCYSGECYLSEMLAGRSANRGACVQACRSRYDLLDGAGRTVVRDRPVLSLKDYNLKSRLWDLAEAGVTSFKIEGRLKNLSYVRNVVREYSLALDALVEGSGGTYGRASFGKVRKGFAPDVSKTFNRGYTAFLMEGPVAEAAEGDGAGVKAAGMQGAGAKAAAMDAPKGEEIGRISHVSKDFRSFKLSGLRGETKLANGDGLAFVSRDGEVVGLRADVCNGTEIRCRQTPELYCGAVVYRNFDGVFEKSMESSRCVRMIDVSLAAEYIAGSFPGSFPGSLATPVAGSRTGSSTGGDNDTRKEILKVTASSGDGSEGVLKVAAKSGDGSEGVLKVAAKSGDGSEGVLKVIATSEDGRIVEREYTGLWNELAANPDRIRSMWKSQMSKTAGHYSFTAGEPASISPCSVPGGMACPVAGGSASGSAAGSAGLPLLSAAAMNHIRADMAAALDSEPCRTRPMYKAGSEKGAPGTDAEVPHKTTEEGRHKTAGEGQRRKITYKDNIANKAAEEIYRSHGFTEIEPAYELSHRRGAELMRSKYCIRRELGLCRGSVKRCAEAMYLLNNGRRLRVEFDCDNCEMIVKED